MGLKDLLIDSKDGFLPDGRVFRQRSLDYGDDKPLITKNLPDVERNLNGISGFVNQVTDNFVRGGIVGATTRAAIDAARLGKMLLTPQGFSWLVSNIALQKTNPENVTSPRNRTFSGVSTASSALSSFAGLRFRRDGLLDFEFENGYNYDPVFGNYKYEKSARLNLDELRFDQANLNNNVLLQLYSANIIKIGSNLARVSNEQDILLEYEGGPHSTFGLGKTIIKKYVSNPYHPCRFLPIYNRNFDSLNKLETGTTGYTDYRSIKRYDINGYNLPYTSRFKQRELVYGLGTPGILIHRNSVNDDGINYGDYRYDTIDQLNASNIYRRENLAEPEYFKDFIKFRIAVVDTSNPLNDRVILFRAFIEKIDDNYSGNWDSFKYNGRAENFYTYSGFERQISFNFKIAAQTRWEMKPLWRKLNYLVAQTSPEYKNRRMRGVFSRLTIGDWMNELPGFFTNINLSWNTSYPWEIRSDSQEGGVDENMNEYPHVLDVSCNFIPVHSFTPSNEPCAPFILPEIGVGVGRQWARPGKNSDSSDNFRSETDVECYTANSEDIAFIPLDDSPEPIPVNLPCDPNQKPETPPGTTTSVSAPKQQNINFQRIVGPQSNEPGAASVTAFSGEMSVSEDVDISNLSAQETRNLFGQSNSVPGTDTPLPEELGSTISTGVSNQSSPRGRFL